MPTYVLLMKITDQGAKDIKGAPKRIEEAIKGFQALGGKMLCFYAVTGKYDYLAIGECPNDEVAMTFGLGLAARGTVRLTTLKAFTKEEFTNIVSKLP
jgi:uncharacterized protein with GYD domain